MKRILICLGIVMMGLVSANAQRFGTPEQQERLQERIEAQRVAYITNQLDLSAEESARFWPIYNDFKEKEREKRQDLRPDKSPEDMTDQEAQALLDQLLEMEKAIVDLKRDYYKQMSDVIGTKKVLRLNHVEMEFNRGVLERLRARQGGPGNN